MSTRLRQHHSQVGTQPRKPGAQVALTRRQRRAEPQLLLPVGQGEEAKDSQFQERPDPG